ncbi:hypothetical protein B0H14DRAFT_3449555 [Mycena olivaceomarginata]|nr:hypothetical protein B0H14DRAFT_3449555 [Mycena olivaceomarginata]
MDSATPTPTGPVTIEPTSSCVSTGATCGIPAAGTLYLFTFLATLLLLGLVIGGIVSRSVYLRRHQRHLIANPPSQRLVPNSNSKPEANDTKSKPRIFDARLSLVRGGDRDVEWESSMPFAATTMLPAELDSDLSRAEPRPPGYQPPPRQAQTNDTAPMATGAENTGDSGSGSQFRRGNRLLRANTNLNANVPGPMAIPPTVERRVTIAYIVLMPRPDEDESVYDEEEPKERHLPFFEFGLAEVDVVKCGGEQEFEELSIEPDGGRDFKFMHENVPTP